MRDVIGLILGGGQGTRLFPLTQFRSKPAVPIGGKYRLIDIPISNCIHSDINRIFVLTQFNSASLHRHISTTYRFDSFIDKNARIGERVSITNREGVREADRDNYYIREGIVVVAKDAVIETGSQI